MTDVPRFGEKPLTQTKQAAAALRRLTGLLVSLENDHPAVDDMLSRLPRWEAELSAAAPEDDAPRIGADPDGRHRVYLDHAFDVGAYNPCFPEYRFTVVSGDDASGTVAFPLVYEGPPGSVHGGFLGVFFDCVVQQHNCATRLAGKTRSLTVKYRRPTPLATELRFAIDRADTDRGLTSTARLSLDGEVLCVGVVETVALPPEKLAGSDFGARRVRAAGHEAEHEESHR